MLLFCFQFQASTATIIYSGTYGVVRVANIQIKSNKQILMEKYFGLLMMSANAL